MRGRACHACGSGAAAAGDRWGRTVASATGAAALTKIALAIDESATKRGLACRTPCALPRALFVDAVAATARRRTGALSRGAQARMVRAVTSWHCFGLVPYRSKMHRAGRDGRRSSSRGLAAAPRRLEGVKSTTCKLRGGPRPWTPAAGRRTQLFSSAAVLPRAVLFCEVSSVMFVASPCP